MRSIGEAEANIHMLFSNFLRQTFLSNPKKLWFPITAITRFFDVCLHIDDTRWTGASGICQWEFATSTSRWTLSAPHLPYFTLLPSALTGDRNDGRYVMVIMVLGIMMIINMFPASILYKLDQVHLACGPWGPLLDANEPIY